VIIKFCLVFPKIFLLHKVVRDAKKVEKHCPGVHTVCAIYSYGQSNPAVLTIGQYQQCCVSALLLNEHTVVH